MLAGSTRYPAASTSCLVVWSGHVSKSSRQFFSFARCVTEVRRVGLRSFQQFIAWEDRDPRIPSNPQRTYKKQWRGWTYFLGGSYRQRVPGMAWASFAEARAYARSLKCGSSREWLQLSKEARLPARIPTSPRTVYEEEFTDWSDFL